MSNSNVKLRHKVHLRKKADAAVDSNRGNSIDSSTTTKKWLVAGGAIILVILCGFGAWHYLATDTLTEIYPLTEVIEASEVATSPEEEEETADEAAALSDKAPVDEEAGTTNEAVAPAEAVSGAQSDNAPTAVAATPAESKPSPASAPDISNDVEVEAMKVIRGDYGVGQERKDKLGSKYQAIQARVNELKRNGVF